MSNHPRFDIRQCDLTCCRQRPHRERMWWVEGIGLSVDYKTWNEAFNHVDDFLRTGQWA